jgi:5,5'-dehydrodivanillate O-demethylase
MAPHPEKPEFVFTGPLTVAGRYLRCFWQPIYESRNLAPAKAISIRILNEDFTLYRDETGSPHVVAQKCPHRGTQLSVGWVEGDSIRCFYHGWKFDPNGTCTEQPAEPRPFCEKIKIAAYPTTERLGLIFAYFGAGSPPPLPQWPEFETQEAVSSIAMIPCNYFQSAENIVDDVHVGFAHKSTPELGMSVRGIVPPRVSARETSFGLSVRFQNSESAEENHFVMPNSCYVSYDLVYSRSSNKGSRFRMSSLFWYVPIDDLTHYHVLVTVGPPLVTEAMRQEQRIPHSVSDEIIAIIGGKSFSHKELPELGKRKPDLVRIQDGVTIVGQGAITDRTTEHLGMSDAGVVLLRKIWLRELRSIANGEPLTPFTGSVDLRALARGN